MVFWRNFKENVQFHNQFNSSLTVIVAKSRFSSIRRRVNPKANEASASGHHFYNFIQNSLEFNHSLPPSPNIEVDEFSLTCRGCVVDPQWAPKWCLPGTQKETDSPLLRDGFVLLPQTDSSNCHCFEALFRAKDLIHSSIMASTKKFIHSAVEKACLFICAPSKHKTNSIFNYSIRFCILLLW